MLFLLVVHGVAYAKGGDVPAFGQFGLWGTVLYVSGMFGIGYLGALLPTLLAGMVLMAVEANRPGRLLAVSVIAPVVIVALSALFFGNLLGMWRRTGFGDLAWWTGQVGQIAAICAAASFLTVILSPAFRRACRARRAQARETAARPQP